MRSVGFAALAAVTMVACGGVEDGGVERGDRGAASASALVAISGVPFWTEIWATDIGSSPFSVRSPCVLGTLESPILLGGFVMDLDRHFGGQTGAMRRTCDVESGKEMLVPLVAVTMDGAGRDSAPPERVLATRVSTFVSGVKDLEVHIDGADARSMDIEFVRTFPESYAYSLPPAGALYDLPGGQLDVPVAVADGIYMVLPKLDGGEHTLLIEGIAGGRQFRVEYVLNAD